MDGHGVACPLGVSLAEEVHEQGVVPAGVLRQLVLVLAGGDGGGHRLVDHGQQPHHKGVVGGPDDGGVELPVGLRPVLALADAAVHILPPGQDLGHLLRGGPAAGQPGGGGLKDLPELEEVPQLPLDLVQVGKAVVVDLGGGGGDEGPLAPAGLQQVLGDQDVDGLPQGGAADPQLLGQLHLPRQFLPGGQAALHGDHGVQPLRRLLGQTFFLHTDLLFFRKGAIPP